MGLNAYFTYTVVKGRGVPWETALSVPGVAFLIQTLLGIGLFIAVIGLLVASPATLVTLGNLRDGTLWSPSPGSKSGAFEARG